MDGLLGWAFFGYTYFCVDGGVEMVLMALKMGRGWKRSS